MTDGGVHYDLFVLLATAGAIYVLFTFGLKR